MIRHLCPVPGGMGVPPWGCTGPVHWLMHVTGIDSQTSYFYDAFSGAVPCLALLALFAGVVGWYRKHNCKKPWCLRWGHYLAADHIPLCRRHHPDLAGRKLTLEVIHRLHREHKQKASPR